MAVGAMVIAGIVMMIVGARPAPPASPPPRPVQVDVPWLSREASAQLVAADGGPGPLFEGVELGLPAPPLVRERIAAFAKANGIDAALEAVEGDVVAIRIGVSYGGCCGYEGADKLALRLHRTRRGSACFGNLDLFVTDWEHLTDAGLHLRARVRVNHLEARWEKPLGPGEVMARADALLGADRAVVARAAGDRWRELAPGRAYQLEVPQRDAGELLDPGIQIAAHAGRIVEVAVEISSTGLRPALRGKPRRVPTRFFETVSQSLRDRSDDALGTRVGEAAVAHWGRPATKGEAWTWRLADRTVTIDVGSSTPTVSIRPAGTSR